MADFNRHLKRSKILVFFTIFAFLYMSCFTSCSKAKNQERAENTQESGGTKKAENSEAPKVQTAGNQEVSGSSSSTPSDSSYDSQTDFSGAKSSAAEDIQGVPLTQEDLDLAAEKLERRFNALEKALAEMPRESFDPQALVDKVGANPIKLFEWVRDMTSLVPYRGILRGSRGVLMDRLGNSLDRALLLQNLLKRSGHEVRLARGKLSGDQARELLANWSIEKREIPFSSESQVSEAQNLVGEVAGQYQLDPSELARLDKTLRDNEVLAGTLSLSVEKQSKEIMEILKGGGITKGDQDQASSANAIQDHWWVQLHQEGKWIDWDPAIPHGNPGTRLAEPENSTQPENIEKDLYCQVTIRVIAERRTKGGLEEGTALEHVFRPCDLYGQQISLQNVPMNWPQDFDPSKETSPLKKMIEVVSAENEWLPVVRVENEAYSQASFNDRGEVLKNPGKGRKTGGVTGVTGGIFGALAGKEEEAEPPSDSVLTAEWIEFEVKTPGAEPRIFRRSIFDLIGPASRSQNRPGEREITSSQRVQRALAVLGEMGILIQGCAYEPEFLTDWTARCLLKNRDILPAYLRHPSQIAGLREIGKKLTRLPGQEHTFGLYRCHLSAEKPKFYLDRPNIVCFRTDLRQSEDGNIVAATGLDIVSNAISFFQTRDVDSFRENVAQGILDTNLEAVLTRAQNGVYNNTAEFFAQSRLQSIKWRLVRNPEDTLLRNLAISEDTKERLAQDLRDGNILILPPTSLELAGHKYFGWWRINPATGETLGISESGQGQAMASYIDVLVIAVGSIACWYSVVHDARGKEGGEMSTCDRLRGLMCLVGSVAGLTGISWLVVRGKGLLLHICAGIAGVAFPIEEIIDKICH